MPQTHRRPLARSEARQVSLDVGRSIRERRETLGISRQKLSTALGISAEQLRRCEAGVASIAASRLYRLSLVLAVPAGSFFEHGAAGGGPARVKERPEHGSPTPSLAEMRRLAETVSRIPDGASRAEMIALVKAVAKMSQTIGALPIETTRRTALRTP